jgi:uncharacterized LabA/DUF88 family protein
LKRHAIFVDAGYLFAQGSVSILGKNSKRTELKIDESEIVKQLKSLALSKNSGAEILRVYWYDGAKNGPTTEHLMIANMQDVKLRLGSINNVGQQKEVDSLLVTDLIDLARNQSICDATVVAGDSDVRIAVQIAQSFGVRVHLVGLEPSRVSQSASLRQEADTVHEISKADVLKFLSVLAPLPSAGPPESAFSVATLVSTTHHSIGEPSASTDGAEKTLEAILDEAVQRTLALGNPDGILRLKEVLSTSSAIPPEYDRRLLGICRTLLNRDLTGDERREMRTVFKRKVLTVSVPEL